MADRNIYDEQNRLSFTRSIDLPDGNLLASIGAVSGASGKINLVGDIAYSYDMPLGQINARLRHDNTAGSDNIEYIVTAMALSYNHNLTPVSSLRLDIDYSDREQSNINSTTKDTGIGVTYNHQLTKDWGLDLGYTFAAKPPARPFPAPVPIQYMWSFVVSLNSGPKRPRTSYIPSETKRFQEIAGWHLDR